MEPFQIAALAAQQPTDGIHYPEFLRRAALSAGLYHLPVGSADPQRPHAEDEVAAGVERRFHTVAQTLSICFFLAPAEYTRWENC